MPTIDVIPMTTPRMVSPDRILFVRTVSNAIATTSQRSASLRAMRFQIADFRLQIADSLTTQSLDWVEPRGPHRRIEAEEQADEGRDANPERDGPDLHRRGNRRERRDGRRDRAAQHRADDAAGHRHQHRLWEDL